MLQEVFYWIFNMSIIATITGMIVILVRLIKKIPRRIMVFLWIVPFIRMMFPVGLNSPYSLMSLLSKITTKTIVVYQPTNEIAFSMTNCIMAAETYFPITYKVNILDDIFGVASVLWIVVLLAILLLLVVTYVTMIYEIKDAIHLKDNIYFSKKIVSPAVYGIIKPKIMLPVSYKHRHIDFVILHEKTHIRSLDNLWRMIAFVIVSVHWFNPFCWLFLKRFLEDLELSCDERVLTKIGTDYIKEYASLLLESRQGTKVFVSNFGGAKIRTRIENILSFQKLTWFSIIVFITLVGTIFYVLLTNAEGGGI